MDQLYLLEVILDNLPDGVYVLDDRGNYIFVNSAYVQALNMPKDVLLHYNVHDFLNTGQIDICVSDIVYREKRQVVMFQDVLDTQNYGRDTIRQMIISTPIFDDSGKIRNILAVVRPLDRLNQLYYQATQAESVSSISGLRASPPVKGSAVIAESPAMRAARRRRSPATSSYPSGRGRTVSGLSTPYSAMLRESSSSCAGGKFCRGWTALGAIASTARYTMPPRCARPEWLENCIANPPYLVFYNIKIDHILRKTRRIRARAEKKGADRDRSAQNRVMG